MKIPVITVAVIGFIQFLHLMTMLPEAGAVYFNLIMPGSEVDWSKSPNYSDSHEKPS